MKVDEIRDIAIDSAKAYYEYLERNDKGIQEVDVFEITYLNSKEFILKLRISAKLFDTDAIFFKNLKNNRKYDVAEIKIIEYDKDKNILLIKPDSDFVNDFKNLAHYDLKVISDLKFLIERVKVWYELNGASIHLPNKVSSLCDEFSNITYFPEEEFQPSKNQKESLKNIFINPFSYVWGAPGTGKTQFVLSYAIMHYITHNLKVAILAPTNNSIEQVLRGVLKMTDKAGIERKQILRLGVPSSKFAEEYPQVCEERGLQNKLEETDKQISILERVLKFEQALSDLKSIETNLRLFDEIPSIIVQIKEKQKLYEKEKERSKKKEIDIAYASEELKGLKESRIKTQKKLNSIGNKVLKIFSLKLSVTSKDISKIEEQIKIKFKEIEYLKIELAEISNVLAKRRNDLNKITNKLSENIKQFKLSINGNPEISRLAQNINIENWKAKKEQIEELVNLEQEKLEIDEQLYADYKYYSLYQIENELNKYKEIRLKLSYSTTEERLKTVNVIACTLDGYISRYSESKLNVEHIFVDEAGYANIIKTLTLFNHEVPISLLGDHMQLPPVCEINDPDIRKDEAFRNMFLWSQSSIYLDSLFQKSRDECLYQYLDNIPFFPVAITNSSLNSTYRFGNNLTKILAKHIYKNGFNSLNPTGETEIIFVNAPKEEGIKSRVSLNEVKTIQKIVNSLKYNRISDFVVLSPYKKQIKLLNNFLPEERNELKILTVHGSQGREWDTVILSVVDTFDMWFVDSKKTISKGLNLVNTAVSRARKQLIIVCDKNYWIKQDGQLITDLLKNGTEILN